jgi:formylglycine-generating enzyme required for sulfatase activity
MTLHSSSISPDWHWPFFSKTLCGTMTDRERLGLPRHQLKNRFDDLSSIYRLYMSCSEQQLISLCENAGLGIGHRIAIGHLLAFLGDQRIDTLTPNMVIIEAANVLIGLDHCELDNVAAEYKELGIDRSWIEKECPRHIVALSSYAIAKYPVTNKEYYEFLLDSGHEDIPSSWHFGRYPQEKSNHPVYTISPLSAEIYCQWLSNKTHRSYRLPTEYEWEYAASGGQDIEFPWGNHFNADFANTAETGLFDTSPVGVFAEGNSLCGCADMAGNVEEYVSDDYKPYPNGTFIADHLVDIHGHYKVARGGSFARFRDLARVKRRHGHNPKSQTYAMGFRLALSLK